MSRTETHAQAVLRDFPHDRCARPEMLVRLLVCQSRIPFPRIAEVLGFEETEAFERWCERATGHRPRVLRELGSGAIRDKLEMRQLRWALFSTSAEQETCRLISVLDPSS